MNSKPTTVHFDISTGSIDSFARFSQSHSRTVAQFKNENVKLRHFYKTKFKLLVVTFFMINASWFYSYSQVPIWMLGQSGVEFTTSTANIVPLSNITTPNFQFINSGFNSAIGPNNEVLFYVDNGTVFYPDGFKMGEINVNYYYNGSTTPTIGTLTGTPEIAIVPVPGRCLQFYIIGCYATRQGNIGSSGANPSLVYATVNMTVQDPNTLRYGVFWNPVSQASLGAQDIFGTSINPEGIGSWQNFDVHTSDMHLAITKLRTNQSFGDLNMRYLFISRGGHLHRSQITASGILPAWEILNYTCTTNAQSGTSISELEVYEYDLENNNKIYRLAFTEGSANRLISTLVNYSNGLTTSNTVNINSFGSGSNLIRGLEFSPNGDFIYTTVSNFPYLRCYDASNLAPIALPNVLPNLVAGFETSMIESGVDDSLYLMNIDGQTIGAIYNPSVPANATFIPNALFINLPYVISNSQAQNQSEFEQFGNIIPISVLPDQVDGEEYSSNFVSNERSCCSFISSYNTIEYFVENDETWQGTSNPISSSNTIRIKDKLIIKTGRTLTISNINFEFGSTGQVIIEPGARLIARGCSFDGNPGCQLMWEGIVVLGNKSLSQRGELYLMDDTLNAFRHCSISNAIIGVSTGMFFDPNGFNTFDGGYFEINNTLFFNNHIGIETASVPISALNIEPVFTIQSFVKQCEFTSNNNMWYPYYRQRTNTFIHTINITSKEIQFRDVNTFDNGEYGFNLQNCNAIIINQAEFSNCLIGIWSNTSGFNGTPSQTTIANNQFINTHTCIRIENGRDEEITANDFNHNNGLQEDNFYGIYLDNCTGFNITDNLFNYNKYGVFVINSGSRVGSITKANFGNYFTGCYRGVHTYLDNSGLLISCNKFINDIPLSYPNQFSSAWFINGDLADQGDPVGFGVNNEFFRIGSRKDIASILDNTSNSCDLNYNFCYFSTLGGAGYTPTINSIYPYCNPRAIGGLPSYCSRQNLMGLVNNNPMLAKDMIANESNELQKRIWTNELLRWYVINNQNDSLISFLQNSTNLNDQEQLFFQFLSQDRFAEASLLLNSIASNTEVDAQQFVALNTITLNITQNNISIKAIDSTSISTVRDIAATDTRISAQARSMLSQIEDNMQNIEILTDTLTNRFGNFEDTKSQFTLYPNPASETSTLQLNFDIENDLLIEVTNVIGKLENRILLQEQNFTMLSFKSYASGVYFVKLYKDGNLLDTQKLVISKN